MGKVISAKEAAELIPDGATVANTSMTICGFAEEIAIAVEARFKETGHPKNITYMHATGNGNWDKKGMNHYAHEGLVKKVISGHVGASPDMAKLVEEDKIEAYFLPQGVVCQLYRSIAGKKPGVITKVGLGTFIDPRVEGGKVTTKCQEDIVKLIELDGEEWLHFKNFPINVAILRGTYADENGNTTFDKEAVLLEFLPMALAAKNSGGIVIVEVESVVKSGTLNPKDVRVPGYLVDYVVVAKPENVMQTVLHKYEPALSGQTKIPTDQMKPLPFDTRKIIARRCAMELDFDAIINLGIGMPDGVGTIAAEEGVHESLKLTTEIGTFGGVPLAGKVFGTSLNPESVIPMDEMFDFYDGGGLDLAVLGLAQTDQYGNVNVSKFGPKAMGPGGFINISQNCKKVVFCGTFTNRSDIKIENNQLVIQKEGSGRKFIENVEQITYNAQYAEKLGQEILFVTERAVFTVEGGELTLIEIAPGIDLDTDILALMDFKPRISPNLKEMDRDMFQPEWGGLKRILDKKSNSSKLMTV